MTAVKLERNLLMTQYAATPAERPAAARRASGGG